MSALDNVKTYAKNNYAAVCDAFSIPCTTGSKEHECPLCGKQKFRIRTTGSAVGTYICTCGVKGAGFGILDLIARKELSASCDVKVDGTTLRKAAMLVDERLSLGYFATEPGYTPPAQHERKARELERKEALERQQHEDTELEAQQINAAARRVHDVLSKTVMGECEYLKAKGFESCLLPVTARGDGVIRLTDIDNRDRSAQYLPPPDALDSEGNKRHKNLMKDAPIKGAFIDVQPNDKANTIIIAEGFATALSVSSVEPLSRVVAAIHAHNLQNVATAFRDRFPALEIVIAADNDYHAIDDVDTHGRPKTNIGLVKANEAAQAIGGLVVFPGCMGRKKQDWDDVRIEMGVERMTEEFKRGLMKARNEKTSGEAEAFNFITSKTAVSLNQNDANYNPISALLDSKRNEPSVGSVSKVPSDVNIAKFRTPDHYKKYYSDKVTPQNQQPDGTEFIVEREDNSITLVNPTTGRGEDGSSGVFKHAKTAEIVRGIKPIMTGFKDNEAYITFENLKDKSRRISLPSATDAKRLAAALRSLGAGVVVDGGLIDFYRNAYLAEQVLPMAIYGSAPGWHEHNGAKFYVSQAGKTYLSDGVRFEFDRTIDSKYKSPAIGSLEDYQANVIELTKGNDGLIFQLLLELASVLFPVRTGSVRAEGITINVYGHSGKGKTLAMRLGASVWGDHAKLTESANATYTALVNSAVSSSGSAMRIDDLSAMGNIRGSDFENLIYSIGNGRGKLRSAVDGKNMPADEFSVICIMTAEKTITEEIWQREGYRFKAGAEARLIEQPFVELQDLKGCRDIKELASALTRAINSFNGIAGDEWLNILCNMGWDSIQSELKKYTNEFDERMCEEFADAMNARPGQKVRAHTLYNVVYAAGMMSQEITGYTNDDIFSAVSENLIVEMASNNLGGKRDEEAVSAFWDYLNSSINRMGAIAREGNKASLQRGGDESTGWLDMVETNHGGECAPTFYLNKRQLNSAARENCGMSGSDLLTLLTKYGYHDTPTDARGQRDGTVQRRVRNGNTTTNQRLLKISEPPEPIEE